MSEIGWDAENAKGGGDDYVSMVSRYVKEGGPLASQGGIDFAYWQLGGVEVGGTGRTAGETETYGLLNRCSTGVASQDQYEAIRKLMSSRPPDSFAV